jgi:hypothetical protein
LALEHGLPDPLQNRFQKVNKKSPKVIKGTNSKPCNHFYAKNTTLVISGKDNNNSFPKIASMMQSR